MSLADDIRDILQNKLKSPFIYRRKLDKSAWEVVSQINEDWDECISNDIIKICDFKTLEDAEDYWSYCVSRWVVDGKPEPKGYVEMFIMR